LRIETPSRLHFGLLVPGPGERRRYGGLGLALAEPRFVLRAWPASTWQVTGLAVERVEQQLHQLLRQPELAGVAPLHLQVMEAIPAHVGLGSGTQLALALAELLARAHGLRPSLTELLRWTRRGARSGVGAAAFNAGGFLLDLGQYQPPHPSPTYLRLDFPSDWQVALFLPEALPGLHGPREREVFDQLDAQANAVSDRLCRLALLHIVPALLEQRYEDFAEGLWEYNRLAGECFRRWQTGHYHSELVARIVDTLRQSPAKAVGQSSWGPAIFAIAPEAQLREALSWAQTPLRDTVRRIIITRASTTGARAYTETPGGEVVPSPTGTVE